MLLHNKNKMQAIILKRTNMKIIMIVKNNNRIWLVFKIYQIIIIIILIIWIKIKNKIPLLKMKINHKTKWLIIMIYIKIFWMIKIRNKMLLHNKYKMQAIILKRTNMKIIIIVKNNNRIWLAFKIYQIKIIIIQIIWIKIKNKIPLLKLKINHKTKWLIIL